MTTAKLPLSAIIVTALATSAPGANASVNSLEYQLNAGVSKQDFRWDIAGSPAGTSPNILSELTWTDLTLAQVEGDVRIPIGAAFLELGGRYGKIFKGENQDSDYLSDNRADEFSRSNNSGDEGTAMMLRMALGTHYSIRPWFVVSPHIGYQVRNLDLVMTDGNQTVDTLTNDLGPFPGLDSSYDSKWGGPFVGLHTSFRYSQKWKWFGSVRLSWDDDYRAKAQWNLRQSFSQPVSFRHYASGSGQDLKMGFTRYFGVKHQNRLSVTLERQLWTGSRGTDRTFFVDGTEASTRLNRVEWDSTSIMFNLSKAF